MAEQQSTMSVEGSTNSSTPQITTEELRKRIRGTILSTKADSRKLVFMGVEIEVRQPPLRVILEQQQSDDPSGAAARMVQRYVFVPGTNVRVFEEADIDAILNLPFSKDMRMLQDAINELTGLELETEDQVKN